MFLKSQIAVIPSQLKILTCGGIFKTKQMPTSIITTDDLREFKLELLEEIEEILSKRDNKPIPINWLRSVEVKRKLKISTGTLHNLRKKRIIKGHKLEGIIFYDASEIDRILLENVVLNEEKDT